MPRTDSREPADDDVEKLFEHIFRDILKDVIRKVCANLGRYLAQTDIDEFTQRIGLLLLEDDYRLLCSFKHESELETWLFTIARRHILRWLRERDRVESLEDKPPNSFIVQQDQEKKLLQKEKRKILQAASRKLPGRKQKLLGLLMREMSRNETAEEMKITRESATVEKVKLVRMLQQIIRKEYSI